MDNSNTANQKEPLLSKTKTKPFQSTRCDQFFERVLGPDYKDLALALIRLSVPAVRELFYLVSEIITYLEQREISEVQNV